MVRTANNILQHELIGLEVEVFKDKNTYNNGIKGKVVDETMNSLLIKMNGIKRISKKNTVFKFKLNGEAVKVEGESLISRPEDRIKKLKKRKW
jgi:RNase P/RNase MRP subunit p29